MSVAGPLVLVVEDEAQMRRFLRSSLTSHGFRVEEAESAREARAMASSHNPDLVLLDLGLPDEDGLRVVETLRAWGPTPIIVVSARGREEDKVRALDLGADDYLTKPFGAQELLARIRVALRHAGTQVGQEDAVLAAGAIAVDTFKRVVTKAGQELHLTPTEYKLLVLLLRNAGRVLTHRQILKEVWGPHHAGQAHSVRVYMNELRKKVEENPSRPALIVTEPGVGYRLRGGDSLRIG